VPGVTFTELFSKPDEYNGRDILLEEFYFHGFETAVLSEGWNIQDTPKDICGHKAKWSGSTTSSYLNVYDLFYLQEMIGPTEHYGKLRINGRFEHDDRYGHAGGFISQIVASKVALLA